MKKKSILILAGCLAFACAACGSDDGDTSANNAANNGANNGANNTLNNTANNAANNTSASSLAAQKLGADLFGTVFLALQINANKNAIEFANEGIEGLADCTDLVTTTTYGQATFDFAAGGNASIYQVEVAMDGCLAIQSGTNPAFTFATQDASGDMLPETFLLNGTLAGVTFDDQGLPPSSDAYDPSIDPTCSNVVFENILVETTGILADGTGFSNEAESHNPGGYSEGTLSADCGTQKLRCQLGGGNAAIALINLDAVAAAKGVESICVFE